MLPGQKLGYVRRTPVTAKFIVIDGARVRIKALPEYGVWAAMIRRCCVPGAPAYEYYGGRGVSVYPAWRDFYGFYAYVGARPTKEHQLDRHPDNNGNYEPGNVRWALRKDNMRNTRGNHVVEIGGQRRLMVEWSEYFGIPYSRMQSLTRQIERIKSKVSVVELARLIRDKQKIKLRKEA